MYIFQDFRKAGCNMRLFRIRRRARRFQARAMVHIAREAARTIGILSGRGDRAGAIYTKLMAECEIKKIADTPLPGDRAYWHESN